jgi:hypothetical protein
MTEQELSKMISEFLPYPAEGQHHALKQFAKLVAAAEREACAVVVEQAGMDGYGTLAAALLVRERGAP